MEKNNSFDKVKALVEANLNLLEEVARLNLSSLDKDCRDFTLSQLKRTIGILGKLVIDDK